MMNLPDFSRRTPRAVALDLDGTTLDSRSTLAARTEIAIEGVVGLGIPVVFATARPARVLPKLIGNRLLAVCSVVQMNGTIAIGLPPLAPSARHPMPVDQAFSCWELVNRLAPAARMTMELDGYRFAVNHDDDVAALWNLNSATSDMIVTVDEALKAEPSKISVNGLGTSLVALRQSLERELAADIDVIPADNDKFINVVHSAATKEGSLRSLLAPTGIGLADVLAFGDDRPDLGILTHCGWSVAVGNAIPIVKSVANYEAPSNDDHGVAVVLERLVRSLDGRAQ